MIAFVQVRRLPLLCILVIMGLSGCGTNAPYTGDANVTKSNNPLVAQYTIEPRGTADAYVEFGTTKSYGQKTATVSTAEGGGATTILVAGMQAGTTYHMRAVVNFANGKTSVDSDHTFTTGTFPKQILPTLKVNTPQSTSSGNGLELVDATLSNTKGYLQAYATDMAGNIVWGYDYPDRDANSIIQPIKPLANGNFGLIISFASQFLLHSAPRGSVNTLREIDLAGNTVRELKIDDLNRRLKSAGFNDLNLGVYHHDFTVLPNGHWMVIAAIVKPFDNLPGYPGTTQVIGDVIVELDPNWTPVWVWNEFDHLDVNRHPMQFPDWTHTNAIIYSPKDGNLLVSMRHQNWLVKVDYRDGQGTGNILWRLGQGGDFQLLNGTDPTDWFYAQHESAIQPGQTSNTQFTLSVMDNGDDRIFPGGVICGDPGQPACEYTTIPVYDIDEHAKTATLRFHQVIPAPQYSFFGGDTNWLPNGNLEYDLCAEPGYTGIVREVKPTGQGTVVWDMTITGSNVYRANRIPSLYQGVTW